jgi:site-specific DNA-methyltransferase (adenine-specific)
MMEISKIVKKISLLHSSSTETPTSFALAVEIISCIPINWKNPNLKILDPACGRGTFLLAVMSVLEKAGHDRKHIIENMLYGVDLNKVQAMIAKKAFNLACPEAEVNIYCEDSLTKVWNMKFDVVVGNPPFDQKSGAKNIKLWSKFCMKALKLSREYIAIITPNNVVSNKGINGENLRTAIKEHDFGFIHAKNHGNSAFKTVNVETCEWIIQKGIPDVIDPIIVKHDLTIDPLVDSIISKVLPNKDNRLPLSLDNLSITKSDLSQSGNPIYFSGDKLKYTTAPVVGSGKLKLLIPFSSSYHKMFVTTEASGMLNMAHYLSSEDEAIILKSYLLSKLFRFVALKYKKTSGFTPFVKNAMLPDLRRSTVWSNEELYAHYNLSDEEIQYIEVNVK